MKVWALIFVVALMAGAVVYDMTYVPNIPAAEPVVKSVAVEKAVVETPSGAVSDDGLIRDVSIETLDGDVFNLRDLEEPIVLLHFWATWCAPCLVEFPMLLDLVEKMDGKLALVAVSMDYHQDALDRFMAKQDIDNSSVYWVRDKKFTLSYDTFGVSQLPETFVIAPDRSLAEHVIGERDWTSEDAYGPLTKLLDGAM